MANYLIIGGSRGIGRKIAEKAIEAGEKVTIVSRQRPEGLDGNFDWQEADVTADFEIDVPEEIDRLVYAPGSINLKPYKRLKKEDLQQDLEINYFGAFKTLQQALPQMQKNGNSSAVFFSTVAVDTGMPFHASIAGAKGALEGMVRSLSAETAPKVRMNIIAPSLTDTDLVENLLNNDKKREASIERHPMKQVASPEDIADLAMWLLSDSAKFITGQTIKADGGISSLKV
ncbi:MAG: SDR family oxidoreductase [Candidatus Kapaibacteriales bacterium]